MTTGSFQSAHRLEVLQKLLIIAFLNIVTVRIIIEQKTGLYNQFIQLC